MNRISRNRIRWIGDRTGVSKAGNFFINGALDLFLNQGIPPETVSYKMLKLHPELRKQITEDEMGMPALFIRQHIPLMHSTIVKPVNIGDIIDTVTGEWRNPAFLKMHGYVTYDGKRAVLHNGSRTVYLARINPCGEGLINVKEGTCSQ